MPNRLCAIAALMVATITSTVANADLKPVLRMEFQVRESGLSDLMEILTRYANMEGFTVEDIGPRLPPKLREKRGPIFYVNLIRQDSTRITVTNFPGQMLLAFYVPKQDTQSQQLIDCLISKLREKWPDIHVYAGP